jgi:hypothetical protein
MGIRDWLARRRHIKRATADFEAGRAAYATAVSGLCDTEDARERSQLYDNARDALIQQARHHRLLYGDCPVDGEPGRDMADSLASSALLFRLLSDVEAAVAARSGRIFRHTVLEFAAGDVLDQMAATRDFAARRALLKDLADAVRPHIGAQATETLWRLPSPGFEGWQTVAEVRQRLEEFGYPPEPKEGGS